MKHTKSPKSWKVPYLGQVYTITRVANRNCRVELNGVPVEDDEIQAAVYMHGFMNLAIPQKALLSWIEVPYDRGFTHKLHLNGETAVISATAAEYLSQIHGFPTGSTRRVAKVVVLPKEVTVPMSLKAKRLLEILP